MPPTLCPRPHQPRHSARHSDGADHTCRARPGRSAIRVQGSRTRRAVANLATLTTVATIGVSVLAITAARGARGAARPAGEHLPPAVVGLAGPTGLTGLPTHARVALDDPTIVAIFDAANTWDIETGTLGQEKGSTKDVRDFGAMLVRDHRMVRQQGRDLATKLGVTPTPPADFALAAKHAAAMRTLQAASGAAFDRAFLQNEVDFHKDVIDAVKTTLLPAIRNQELKDFVTKVAPAFQAHMIAAQQKLDALPR